MLSAESSEEVERTDLTPAKRRGTSIVNLEEAVDQNSVTRIHVLLESRRKRLKKVANEFQQVSGYFKLDHSLYLKE